MDPIVSRAEHLGNGVVPIIRALGNAQNRRSL
jgi:hypothetical protein